MFAKKEVVKRQQIQEILEYLENLQSGLEKYMKFNSGIIRSITEGIEGGSYSEITEALKPYAENQPFYLLQSTSALQHIGEAFKSSCDLSRFADIATENSDVKLYTNDEILCIKTPGLSSRNCRTFDKRFGAIVYKLLYANCEALPRIKSKSVIAFNVYSSEVSDIHKIDPDNLDTKNVIDQISKFYQGDSGVNTTYLSMTYTTDDIPEGTYIICAPKEKGLIFEDEIADVVHALLRSEKSKNG